MVENKESKWKKKGFYLSVCTALICLLAVGTVYYKMNSPLNNKAQNESQDPTKEQKKTAENGRKSTLEAANNRANRRAKKLEELKQEKKKQEEEIRKKENEQKKEAKASNKENKNKTKETSLNVPQRMFDEEKGLLWPVSGKILLKYSMKNTIYFKTLAQYKCNPAMEIAAKIGANVKSAAGGTVVSVKKEDETGQTVSVNIGDGYVLKYGQLKDVSVKNGQQIKEGQKIGKIAKPTSYFSEEGSNLYFQVTQNGKTVDPMLLLR